MNAINTLSIEASEITGSEKQIAWATEIRDEVLRALAAIVDPNTYTTHKDMVGKLESDADTTRVARATAMVLASVSSAKWWIDNRDYLYGVRSKLTKHTEWGVNADSARAIRKVLSDALVTLRASIPNFAAVFAAAQQAA